MTAPTVEKIARLVYDVLVTPRQFLDRTEGQYGGLAHEIATRVAELYAPVIEELERERMLRCPKGHATDPHDRAGILERAVISDPTPEEPR